MFHVLKVPDKELVATAGIDALAFIRVSQFGIQLFLPVTIVAVFVLIPVHTTGKELDRQRAYWIATHTADDAVPSGMGASAAARTARTRTRRRHIAFFALFPLRSHRSIHRSIPPPPRDWFPYDRVRVVNAVP